MNGGGSVLSVDSDHLLGLVALVALPLATWLLLSMLQQLAARDVPWATRLVDRLTTMPNAARAALFACAAGAVVHAVLVRPHWGEDRTRAILFVFDAIGFVVAFVWTLTLRPGWRAIALTLMASTVVGYAYYVLRGWESVDLVGLVTTSIELAAALILVAAIPVQVPAPARESEHLRTAEGDTQADARERWVIGLSLPLALLTVLGTGVIAQTHLAASDNTASAGMGTSINGGGPAMPNMPGMNGTSANSGLPLSLRTTSPAGDIVWPVSMAGMGPGMRMVPRTCPTRPTALQQVAAVRLVDETVAAVARYRSLSAAKAAGYVPVTPSGQPVVHYVNRAIYRHAHPLDPKHIPSLVYVNTDHGAVLAAAMYLMPPAARSQRPPQPGGCLTQWHVHTNLCFHAGRVVATTLAGICPSGSVNRLTEPMMHVWLAPVPGGPLAPAPTAHDELLAVAKLAVPNPPNGKA